MSAKRSTSKSGGCEWERLMKERSELLESGCYTHDDPLIMELDRQIQASQVRNDGSQRPASLVN